MDELSNALLSKNRQNQRVTCWSPHLYEAFRTGCLQRRSGLVVATGCGEVGGGCGERLWTVTEFPFGAMERVRSELEETVSQCCECAKCPCRVYFKLVKAVNFVSCEFDVSGQKNPTRCVQLLREPGKGTSGSFASGSAYPGQAWRREAHSFWEQNKPNQSFDLSKWQFLF